MQDMSQSRLLVPFVLCGLLIGCVVPSQAREGELRRFYVYNECFKSIIYTAQYAPPGMTLARRSQTVIFPGHRRRVATELVDYVDDNGVGSIVGWAISRDRSMSWASRGVPSFSPIMTYVIGCNCSTAAVCKLPPRWNDELAPRQYPGGDP